MVKPEPEFIDAEFELIEETSTLVPVPIAMNKLRPANADETSFIVVAQGEELQVFPRVQPPEVVRIAIAACVSRAAEINITSEESDKAAYALSKEINKYKLSVSKTVYELWRDRANKLHKFFVQLEKDGLEPLVDAVASIDTKRAAWVTAENARRLKEAEELAAKALRKQQAALALAQAKLERFRTSAADDRALLDQITAELDSPEIGDEEAGVMRAEMVLLEARLNTTQEKAAVVEAKVETVSYPVSAETFFVPVAAKGMAKKKVVVAINWALFLPYLAGNQCPIRIQDILTKSASTAIMSSLGQYVQNRTMPGVTVKEEDQHRHG